MSTDIEKAAATGQKHPIVAYIRESQDTLRELGMDPVRFAAIVADTIRGNPEIAKCDPSTLLGAVYQCATLGLEPGPTLGHAFLIPFRKRGAPLQCQFVLGYKGMIALAARAGIAIVSRTVYPSDDFDYAYGSDPYIKHRPNLDRPKGEHGVHWYAIATTDGETADKFVVLGRSEVEEHRAASAAPNSPAWRDWFDPMAEKTAIRVLWKQLPTDRAMLTALMADETVTTLGDAKPTLDRERDDRPSEPPGGADDVQVLGTESEEVAILRADADLADDDKWQKWRDAIIGRDDDAPLTPAEMDLVLERLRERAAR